MHLRRWFSGAVPPPPALPSGKRVGGQEITSRRKKSFTTATSRIVLLIFFGGISVTNFLAYSRVDTEAATFHLVAAAFAFYLLAECLNFLSRNDTFGLLSPVILASIAHFGLTYLLGTAAIQLDPAILDRFAAHLPELYGSLTTTLLIAFLAAFAMWRGYDLGRPAAGALRRMMSASALIRSELRPAMFASIAIQVGYFCLVAWAIQLGVFGVSSSAESREEHIALLEIIRIALSAGTLTFFLIATQYYRLFASRRANLGFTLFVALLIILHVAVGALSGFKSQIVMPFVMLGIAYFVATLRISRTLIILGVIALTLSYQVVEPYRAYLRINNLYGRSDIETLSRGMVEVLKNRSLYTHESDTSLSSQIAQRVDNLGMSSVGIEFTSSGAVDPAQRSKLMDSIIFSPLLAFVPRAIWSTKPSYNTGVWFNQVVLGKRHDSVTSVGMGPLALTYMAGGLLGVVGCFLFLGWLQATLFEGAARSGVGGLIIFFSASTTLVMIPTEFGLALGGIWRILPFAVVAQFILLRPAQRPL